MNLADTQHVVDAVDCQCAGCVKRRRTVAAQHRPRSFARGQIRSEHEQQRISRVDEESITERAHKVEKKTYKQDLGATLARMERDLERVSHAIGRVAPGDHRGYLREIEHGLKGLSRLVT